MKLQKLFLSLAILGALGLAGCDVTRIVDSPVRPNMTSHEVLKAFGPPLRVETKPDGGKDWVYKFATSFTESGFTSGFDDDDDCDGGFSSGHYESSGICFAEGAIEISPQGRVTGEIPQGRVVGRR